MRQATHPSHYSQPLGQNLTSAQSSNATPVQSRRWRRMSALLILLLLAAIMLFDNRTARTASSAQAAREDNSNVDLGREIFRYDTFGDEQQWTDRLKMHEVIESALDPITALQLGLKVDVD